MNEFFTLAAVQWQAQSMAELVAVVLSVAYVWLAAEESIWCWAAALISTLLFSYVFWDVSLFFQMLLNIYYVVMAIVGFLHWKKQDSASFDALSMSLYQHAIFIFSGVVLSGFLYMLASTLASDWFSYELLYLDAGLTVFSLMTTYLTVKKYLQSWMYWSIINACSIYLFIDSQLYMTVLLMVLYILIALRGYINWSQDLVYEHKA